MSRSAEHTLVRRAAAGDRAAANQLIRLHQASLYAYLVRMCGRPDTAEDVVQEAFVRVLTNLDRFDPRFRFSTWLFTIARRVFLNMCEKRRPASDSDRVDAWQGSGDSPAQRAQDRDANRADRDELQAALDHLPEDQREIVILFHQQDWPIAIIAAHMGMPEGTIKSHLHRGRIRLRDLIVKAREQRARAAEPAATPGIPQEVWS